MDKLETYLITTDQPKTTESDELPPVMLPKWSGSVYVKKNHAYASVIVDE
jgi:hypothetical protein